MNIIYLKNDIKITIVWILKHVFVGKRHVHNRIFHIEGMISEVLNSTKFKETVAYPTKKLIIKKNTTHNKGKNVTRAIRTVT